jgi:hypothetical protein
MSVRRPGALGLAAFMPAGDVVKIAIPKIDTTKNLSFSVDSIKMGNSNASFGSVAANDINCRARPSTSGHIERVHRLAQEAMDLASRARTKRCGD